MCYACDTLYEIIDVEFLAFIGAPIIAAPYYTFIPCLEMPALVAYILYKRPEVYQGRFDGYFDACIETDPEYPASMWELFDRRIEMEMVAHEFIGPICDALDDYYPDEPKGYGIVRTYRFDIMPPWFREKKYRFSGYYMGVPLWYEADSIGDSLRDIISPAGDAACFGHVLIEILRSIRREG